MSNKCGLVIASNCVPYSGKDFTFVDEGDELLCDATVTVALEKIDKYLKRLVDSNNFKDLNKNCLDFDPTTIDAKGLDQIEIDQICLLKGQITTLTNSINNLNIGTEVITLDLDCLTPDATACAVGTNQYQLINILTLFVSKLCDFETRISNLES